jgi:two-component system, OmpR family, sensor histidine kinase BaeS
MNRSLTFKLIIAFLVVSLVGIGLVALLAGRIARVEVSDFVRQQQRQQLARELTDYYQQQGSWRGVEEMVFPSETAAGVASADTGRPLALADNNRRVIRSGAGYQVGSRVPQGAMVGVVTPLLVDGQPVGVLVGQHRHRQMPLTIDSLMQRIGRLLLLGAGGAALVALLLGTVLARTLVRPLRELTSATQAMAEGDLNQRVPVRSQDELGQLAAAFNEMNQKLSQARQQRRQLTADIAHDLRTPLSLILGHAEAMRDGVLPADPETLAIVHDEARRLARLVEDLRLLSLSEAGELPLNLSATDPQQMLLRATAVYQQAAEQQQISLTIEAAPDLPPVRADGDRLTQVWDNLLANSLRHTPPGGQIRLRALAGDGEVIVQVADTGPGIEPAALPHIFERFYRADGARRREDGGSGLGLAIARSIVVAHNGRIWAESELGQGTTVYVALPVGNDGTGWR